MAEPLLEVRGLTHSFPLGRRAVLRAVDHVSFTLRRGEVLGLVGESGSGKSTIARCVMNLLRPQSGQILYRGIDICDRRAFRANRRTLQAKRQIIELYRNDVARFARGYEFKVVSVLDGIPGQLSKHEKKFTLSSISKNARMRTYEEAFFWLSDARIANICYASTDPSVGLGLSVEQTSLKCYMADTGLLATLALSTGATGEEGVYRAVLRGDVGLNEGMLVENVVAQCLVANGRKLFFYSQSGKKENQQRMEIDFLIVRPYVNAAGKPRISPIEVKSPRQYGTVSLDRLKETFDKKIGTQYVLHPKQMKIEGDRVYLPLYMAGCL